MAWSRKGLKDRSTQFCALEVLKKANSEGEDPTPRAQRTAEVPAKAGGQLGRAVFFRRGWGSPRAADQGGRQLSPLPTQPRVGRPEARTS